ncbi:hypothetical protein JI667_18950 [Bacillus sp. NTK074B]|uniref:VC0807 family protein n=1 Tax=Bacillus sp. NTK074B TaxID=2802174 RepID=UPI001A8C6CAC|nr:hypothetical protein [Bacillus sp. NTK074B]
MGKKIILSDLFFYVIFPIVIWNVFREYLGDYNTMLVSSLPGIAYSFIRFVLVKKLNLFGLFIILNLTIDTVIRFLSGTAIQLLWNDVLYSYAVAFFFLVTILIKKPLFLYFSLDFIEMQGKDRKIFKEIFYQKKIFIIFNLITLGFALRDVLIATIKIVLIVKYGVDAFDEGIVVRQILNWGLTGLSIYGFVHISKLISSQSHEKFSG